MLSVEWNKKKLDNFYKKMEKLAKELPNGAKTGIKSALNNTQKVALKNKRGSSNEKMILVELVDATTSEIMGRVYTNKDLFSYAPFMEFGTGTKLDPAGPGAMPEHTATYIQSGGAFWLLPMEKVGRNLNNKIICINGSYYYLMYATRPYPFMRPAAFQTRNDAAKLVGKEIKNKIREVLK